MLYDKCDKKWSFYNSRLLEIKDSGKVEYLKCLWGKTIQDIEFEIACLRQDENISNTKSKDSAEVKICDALRGLQAVLDYDNKLKIYEEARKLKISIFSQEDILMMKRYQKLESKYRMRLKINARK
jgi:hypothetical protein